MFARSETGLPSVQPPTVPDVEITLASRPDAPRTGSDAGGLHLLVSADASAMWTLILDRWRGDETASLVLPGSFARERFLRAETTHTLWGAGRVLTLMDLWLEVADAIKERLDLPNELLAPEVEPVLAAKVEGILPLAPLAEQKGGLLSLALHLEQIEKQADSDYAPQTDVERALAELRERMEEEGQVLQAARRSYVARNAKLVELGRTLLFPPLPELSRQLGGLLKGLARQNRVEAFLLGNEAVLPSIAAQIGVGVEEVELRSSAGDGPAAVLFDKDGSPPAQGLSGIWALADSEAAAAIDIVKGWIESGADPAGIVIASPDPEAIAHELAQLAGAAGVPLLVRDSVETRDSALATLLLRLARLDYGERDAADALFEDAAGQFGLTTEQFDALEAARRKGPAAELSALYTLGRSLAEPESAAGGAPYDVGRAQAWLDGLHSAVYAIGERGIDPWDVAELIEGSKSLRSPRGRSEGVALVSYAELASLRVERACLLGLNADEYPPPPQRSAFTSEALLELCPALASSDARPQFVAAVAAISTEVAFIRSRHGGAAQSEATASGFWLESRRAFDAEGQDVAMLHGENLEAMRPRARAAARRRAAAHAEIELALAQAQRRQLPDELGQKTRRPYTVTELEAYLRCPYGWFVDHVLAPRTPPSQGQRRGNISHSVLAELFGSLYAPYERGEAVRQAGRAPGAGLLTARDRQLLSGQLERVVDRYGSSAWPFTEHRCEEALRLEVSGGIETLRLQWSRRPHRSPPGPG